MVGHQLNIMVGYTVLQLTFVKSFSLLEEQKSFLSGKHKNGVSSHSTFYKVLQFVLLAQNHFPPRY